jgi:hypothetical protein
MDPSGRGRAVYGDQRRVGQGEADEVAFQSDPVGRRVQVWEVIQAPDGRFEI